jgi:hypothetical protein
MRNQTHSDPFSARLRVSQTLWAISKSEPPPHALNDLAIELDELSLQLSSPAAAKAYGAMGSVLRIVDALTLWRSAVLDAQVDADRFLRSARERYSMWTDEYGQAEETRTLIAAADAIGRVTQIADVMKVTDALSVVPLPIGVFAQVQRPPWAAKLEPHEEKPEELVELTVAFLKFQIDDQPAKDVHHVPPREVHDLQIEVRVSRWPEGKHELRLTPVSVEPKSTYDFPEFVFRRPDGPAPFTLRQNGRAVLHLPQGMHSRPFEFKYTAEFLPEKGEQPVAIVGHRTLMLDGTDLDKLQICGYRTLDRRLFQVRDYLRTRRGVPQDEGADALLVLTPLCGLAGRAVQDAEFKGVWTEARFQEYVRAELRRSPLIGEHLDEHAHAAGGITDLSLRGMPIELKVHGTLIASTDDCAPYLAQTTSYAVAKSKRTAILCVLDTSEKSTSPQSPERLLGVSCHSESGVWICILVIQGNLARPSDLSR